MFAEPCSSESCDNRPEVLATMVGMSLNIAELAPDAVGLGQLVKDGQVHPLELVDSVIDAIERTNGDLNAVITPMFEMARDHARSAAVDSSAPFAGVPFLLKDIRAAYTGVPTSDGCGALRDVPKAYDSEIVRRHRRAGLICVGKTNTPEFGLTATTEPHAFGPTKNPWNLDRTPGGSSGGAAAAVAARILPMAHASDGGGSIRIPAACCGLFGLKPTRGRNPLGPDSGDVMNGLVVEHALTVSVRDSAALLDATAGPDLGDPYCAPPAETSFSEAARQDPGALRVALSTGSPFGTAVDAECVEAVESTGRLLQELGHTVELAAPEYDDRTFRAAFTTIWFSNLAAGLAQLSRDAGRELAALDVEPITLELGQRGAQSSGPDYVAAVAVLQQVGRQVAQFFQGFDIWVTPVISAPPPPLGFLHPRPGEMDLGPFGRRVREWVPYTQLANATGQPAASIPLHWTADGLPVGVQFTARFGEECTLLRLAAQLEAARPWRDRRPPLCA